MLNWIDMNRADYLYINGFGIKELITVDMLWNSAYQPTNQQLFYYNKGFAIK